MIDYPYPPPAPSESARPNQGEKDVTTNGTGSSDVWNARSGRRTTDARVPNTAEVMLIADDLARLIMVPVGVIGIVVSTDERREIVARILPWLPRGDDIAFILGTEI